MSRIMVFTVLMATHFRDNLERLADALVYSAGVDTDAHVLLHTHTGAEELAALVADKCRAAGAETIDHFTLDPQSVYEELMRDPEKEFYDFAPEETNAWQRMMENDGCVIQIRTDIDPALFAPLSAAYGRWYKQMLDARGGFKERGVNKGEFAWTLLYIPTESSACRVYPELPAEEALSAYWNAVFSMTFADQSDCIAALQKTDAKLRERYRKLNDLHIKSLHVTGTHTDFTIGLSRRAQWLSGTKLASGKSRRKHTMNLPTYEVFTTPDWRTVQGTIRITKDVLIEGTMVKDASLTFEKGRVLSVTASEGEAALNTMVRRDTGAAQVGEIALVGLDSPVAKQGRVFQSPLCDENAACHFALGGAYWSAIKDHERLASNDIEELGINESSIHTDLMISDEHTTVTATTYTGEKVTLIENGHWTPDFA